MNNITSADRERQRFDHLVLGLPRPKPLKPSGKRKRTKRAAEPIVLAPGIEERVQLRERWSHKAQGTAETHEYADRVRRRAGTLARLYSTGTINADQLAAAQEIAETYEAIGAAVGLRSSFALQKVNVSFRPELAGAELTGRALRELAYDAWRASIVGSAAAVLAMVVDDAGLTVVARRYRMSDRKARALLVGALDQWIAIAWRRRR